MNKIISMCCGVFFLCFATAGFSATVNWQSTSSTSWGDDANWVGLAPDGNDDIAQIPHTTGPGIQPILDLGGNTYTLNRLVFRTDDGPDGPFTVQNGTLILDPNDAGITGQGLLTFTDATDGSEISANLTMDNALNGRVVLAIQSDLTISGNIVANDDTAFQVQNGGSASVSGAISGSGTILKTGGNTMNFSGEHTGSGQFQVFSGTMNLSRSGGAALSSGGGLINLVGGDLALAASGQIDRNVLFNGGILSLNGFNNTSSGTADLNNTSVLDFGGVGGQYLEFADSSLTGWTSGRTLSITGVTFGSDSLRFGTSSSGLNGTQLSQITVNGSSGYTLDANGFLFSAVPEPGTLSMLAVGCWLLYFVRSRKIILKD